MTNEILGALMIRGADVSAERLYNVRTWKKKRKQKAVVMTLQQSKRVKKCLTLICLYRQRVVVV